MPPEVQARLEMVLAGIDPVYHEMQLVLLLCVDVGCSSAFVG
jgi:hypothetical protein